jgi:hypothetical protein
MLKLSDDAERALVADERNTRPGENERQSVRLERDFFIAPLLAAVVIRRAQTS